MPSGPICIDPNLQCCFNGVFKHQPVIKDRQKAQWLTCHCRPLQLLRLVGHICMLHSHPVNYIRTSIRHMQTAGHRWQDIFRTICPQYNCTTIPSHNTIIPSLCRSYNAVNPKSSVTTLRELLKALSMLTKINAEWFRWYLVCQCSFLWSLFV